MNYLITGGAGFIGSHLADALIERGDTVIALDDVSTGSIDNVRHLLDHPNFTLREGTVLNHPLVAQLAGRAEVVIHLAAAVGVKLIVEKPLQSLITNIRGTEIVLDASEMGGCRVLVTSRRATWDPALGVPRRTESIALLRQRSGVSGRGSGVRGQSLP